VRSHPEKAESRPALIHLLKIFAVVNRVTGGRFHEMEDRLLHIALAKAYVPTK
jgi:hypothetical protein